MCCAMLYAEPRLKGFGFSPSAEGGPSDPEPYLRQNSMQEAVGVLAHVAGSVYCVL